MENFVVSARKHRPHLFTDVTGQSHVTRTLQNAISNNQLAQAFLFCGPRGVGKTTCARILAKTINCYQVTEDIEPCNECESCQSFNQNASFNVHELDAASHNSVEDIRNLVDQVRYPPQSGKYKVYIVDEVHMLSNAAFNAFLKTLEEPPSYAIFILATTEKHKILPTIISRCQAFDFRRIQPQDIAQQLITIAEKDQITYEEEAIHLLSQKADGSLRDALSMFDLIVTFDADHQLTYQAALHNLHVLDYDYYFKLTDAFLQGDIASILLLYDEILRNGFDSHHFIVGLSEHFRSLLVCQDAATVALLHSAENVRARYQEQANEVNPTYLFKALDLTGQCDIQYKASKNKRLHVELTLLKLARINQEGNEKGATTIKAKKPSSQSTPVTLPKSPPKQAPPKPATDSIQNQPAARPTKEVTPPEVASPPSSSPKAQVKAPDTPASPTLKAAPTPRETTAASSLKIPSLKDLKQQLKPQETPPTPPKEEVIQAYQGEDQPFTEETLKAHWESFLQMLKQSDKMQAYSTLNQPFELKDQTIHLALNNPVQQSIVEDHRTALMSYLREKLQTNAIALETHLIEQKKTDVAYTNREKFEKLSQDNPALQSLQQQLDLELDC